MSNGKARQYVLLPPRSLSASRSALAASTSSFFRSLPQPTPETSDLVAAIAVPEGNIRVLDSIHEDGAKLVEMTDAAVDALHAAQPDIIIAPVVYYEIATVRRPSPRAVASTMATSPAALPGTIQIRVVDAKTGNGVRGAQIAAFTDFANGFGAGGVSDQDGEVALNFGVSQVQIERLYVFPPLAGYWGFFQQNMPLQSGFLAALEPIDLTVVDALRFFHGAGNLGDGAEVIVAVIDTGVGPHPDLLIAGTEGNGGDLDNGEGHGTHVAGIIASRGLLPNGLAGVAPAVTLRSYRVFSAPGGLAANFDIAKAIDQAVADGCHLINLSLKIDAPSNPSGFVIDPVVQAALEDARQAGSLPIAAAGNDSRTAVDFPARHPLCLAVSALGRIGTFPPGSTEEADLALPAGTDPNDFIAAFSNVGPEVDLTAPGVGVVSTVPGGYGVLSGTSMACPAVTGMTARLLAQNPEILNLPGDSTRSAEFARLALQSVRTLGFPADMEGQGIIV